MVHRIAWPLFDSFRIKVAMDQAVWLSRPEVGSSRKRSKSGLAASSTPILSRFRCSTLRPNYKQVSLMMSWDLLARVVQLTSMEEPNAPSPGTPMIASAYWPMSSS